MVARGALMPEQRESLSSDIPFCRAYDWILADPDLTASEKLVLAVVLRYWPRPCTMTSATIARQLGMDAGYVRNVVNGLCQGPKERRESKPPKPPRRAYLRRECVGGKPGEKGTVRYLAPIYFPPGDSTRGRAP